MGCTYHTEKLMEVRCAGMQKERSSDMQLLQNLAARAQHRALPGGSQVVQGSAPLQFPDGVQDEDLKPFTQLLQYLAAEPMSQEAHWSHFEPWHGARPQHASIGRQSAPPRPEDERRQSQVEARSPAHASQSQEMYQRAPQHLTARWSEGSSLAAIDRIHLQDADMQQYACAGHAQPLQRPAPQQSPASMHQGTLPPGIELRPLHAARMQQQAGPGLAQPAERSHLQQSQLQQVLPKLRAQQSFDHAVSMPERAQLGTHPPAGALGCAQQRSSGMLEPVPPGVHRPAQVSSRAQQSGMAEGPRRPAGQPREQKAANMQYPGLPFGPEAACSSACEQLAPHGRPGQLMPAGNAQQSRPGTVQQPIRLSEADRLGTTAGEAWAIPART